MNISVGKKFKVPYKVEDEWFYEWAGKIPEEWDVARGKYMFKNKKEINKDNQCEIVLALTLLGVIRKDKLKARSLVPSDYSTYQIFEKGDLVFKLIDLENYQTSRVGVSPEKGIMSSAYIRLIPLKNLHIKYFYYYYFALYMQGIYNFLGMGVRSTLNYGDLLNIPLLVPPLDVQKKIVEYLDPHIDQITNIEKMGGLRFSILREYKISLIYNAVTGKIKI